MSTSAPALDLFDAFDEAKWIQLLKTTVDEFIKLTFSHEKHATHFRFQTTGKEGKDGPNVLPLFIFTYHGSWRFRLTIHGDHRKIQHFVLGPQDTPESLKQGSDGSVVFCAIDVAVQNHIQASKNTDWFFRVFLGVIFFDKTLSESYGDCVDLLIALDEIDDDDGFVVHSDDAAPSSETKDDASESSDGVEDDDAAQKELDALLGRLTHDDDEDIARIQEIVGYLQEHRTEKPITSTRVIREYTRMPSFKNEHRKALTQLFEVDAPFLLYDESRLGEESWVMQGTYTPPTIVYSMTTRDIPHHGLPDEYLLRKWGLDDVFATGYAELRERVSWLCVDWCFLEQAASHEEATRERLYNEFVDHVCQISPPVLFPGDDWLYYSSMHPNTIEKEHREFGVAYKRVPYQRGYTLYKNVLHKTRKSNRMEQMADVLEPRDTKVDPWKSWFDVYSSEIRRQVKEIKNDIAELTKQVQGSKNFIADQFKDGSSNVNPFMDNSNYELMKKRFGWERNKVTEHKDDADPLTYSSEEDDDEEEEEGSHTRLARRKLVKEAQGKKTVISWTTYITWAARWVRAKTFYHANLAIEKHMASLSDEQNMPAPVIANEPQIRHEFKFMQEFELVLDGRIDDKGRSRREFPDTHANSMNKEKVWIVQGVVLPHLINFSALVTEPRSITVFTKWKETRADHGDGKKDHEYWLGHVAYAFLKYGMDKLCRDLKQNLYMYIWMLKQMTSQPMKSMIALHRLFLCFRMHRLWLVKFPTWIRCVYTAFAYQQNFAVNKTRERHMMRILYREGKAMQLERMLYWYSVTDTGDWYDVDRTQTQLNTWMDFRIDARRMYLDPLLSQIMDEIIQVWRPELTLLRGEFVKPSNMQYWLVPSVQDSHSKGVSLMQEQCRHLAVAVNSHMAPLMEFALDDQSVPLLSKRLIRSIVGNGDRNSKKIEAGENTWYPDITTIVKNAIGNPLKAQKKNTLKEMHSFTTDMTRNFQFRAYLRLLTKWLHHDRDTDETENQFTKLVLEPHWLLAQVRGADEWLDDTSKQFLQGKSELVKSVGMLWKPVHEMASYRKLSSKSSAHEIKKAFEVMYPKRGGPLTSNHDDHQWAQLLLYEWYEGNIKPTESDNVTGVLKNGSDLRSAMSTIFSLLDAYNRAGKRHAIKPFVEFARFHRVKAFLSIANVFELGDRLQWTQDCFESMRVHRYDGDQDSLPIQRINLLSRLNRHHRTQELEYYRNYIMEHFELTLAGHENEGAGVTITARDWWCAYRIRQVYKHSKEAFEAMKRIPSEFNSEEWEAQPESSDSITKTNKKQTIPELISTVYESLMNTSDDTQVTRMDAYSGQSITGENGSEIHRDLIESLLVLDCNWSFWLDVLKSSSDYLSAFQSSASDKWDRYLSAWGANWSWYIHAYRECVIWCKEVVVKPLAINIQTDMDDPKRLFVYDMGENKKEKLSQYIQLAQVGRSVLRYYQTLMFGDHPDLLGKFLLCKNNEMVAFVEEHKAYLLEPKHLLMNYIFMRSSFDATHVDSSTSKAGIVRAYVQKHIQTLDHFLPQSKKAEGSWRVPDFKETNTGMHAMWTRALDRLGKPDVETERSHSWSAEFAFHYPMITSWDDALDSATDAIRPTVVYPDFFPYHDAFDNDTKAESVHPQIVDEVDTSDSDDDEKTSTRPPSDNDEDETQTSSDSENDENYTPDESQDDATSSDSENESEEEEQSSSQSQSPKHGESFEAADTETLVDVFDDTFTYDDLKADTERIKGLQQYVFCRQELARQFPCLADAVETVPGAIVVDDKAAHVDPIVILAWSNKETYGSRGVVNYVRVDIAQALFGESAIVSEYDAIHQFRSQPDVFYKTPNVSFDKRYRVYYNIFDELKDHRDHRIDIVSIETVKLFRLQSAVATAEMYIKTTREQLKTYKYNKVDADLREEQTFILGACGVVDLFYGWLLDKDVMVLLKDVVFSSLVRMLLENLLKPCSVVFKTLSTAHQHGSGYRIPTYWIALLQPKLVQVTQFCANGVKNTGYTEIGAWLVNEQLSEKETEVHNQMKQFVEFSEAVYEAYSKRHKKRESHVAALSDSERKQFLKSIRSLPDDIKQAVQAIRIDSTPKEALLLISELSQFLERVRLIQTKVDAKGRPAIWIQSYAQDIKRWLCIDVLLLAEKPHLSKEMQPASKKAPGVSTHVSGLLLSIDAWLDHKQTTVRSEGPRFIKSIDKWKQVRNGKAKWNRDELLAHEDAVELLNHMKATASSLLNSLGAMIKDARFTPPPPPAEFPSLETIFGTSRMKAPSEATRRAIEEAIAPTSSTIRQKRSSVSLSSSSSEPVSKKPKQSKDDIQEMMIVNMTDVFDDDSAMDLRSSGTGGLLSSVRTKASPQSLFHRLAQLYCCVRALAFTTGYLSFEHFVNRLHDTEELGMVMSINLRNLESTAKNYVDLADALWDLICVSLLHTEKKKMTTELTTFYQRAEQDYCDLYTAFQSSALSKKIALTENDPSDDTFIAVASMRMPVMAHATKTKEIQDWLQYQWKAYHKQKLQDWIKTLLRQNESDAHMCEKLNSISMAMKTIRGTYVHGCFGEMILAVIHPLSTPLSR